MVGRNASDSAATGSPGLTGAQRAAAPAAAAANFAALSRVAGTHRKCRSSLISRSVRWQNMAWSNGVIRLIATLVPEAMWTAELASA